LFSRNKSTHLFGQNINNKTRSETYFALFSIKACHNYMQPVMVELYEHGADAHARDCPEIEVSKKAVFCDLAQRLESTGEDGLSWKLLRKVSGMGPQLPM
jgi:hypothetical protein